MVIPKKAVETEQDLRPDAWQRFERAVDVVMKSPPQHRKAPDKSKVKPREGRQPTKQAPPKAGLKRKSSERA